MADAANTILLVTSNSSSPTLFFENDIGLPSQSSASLLEEGEPIPWTISNRYYDAPVNFIVRSIENVALSDVADVPAIVFLCGPEQSLQDDFREFAPLVSENDKLEVALAVFRTDEAAPPSDADQADELEAFFDDHGFEFINLSSPSSLDDTPPPTTRVVDALSTIMWPSMVRKPRTVRLSGSIPEPVRVSEQSLKDISIASIFAGFQAMDLNSEEAMRREREAFEKWLDVDNEEIIGFPGVMESNDPALPSPGPSQPGFDDDFSDFIQASHGAEPSFPLSPTSSMFASASSSTRDPNEVGENEDGDLFDDDMPSASEIDSTMRQIFGRSAGMGDDVDFAHILSALQAMKEEVSGLPTEAERRKAAARVALGLVYGLDGPVQDPDADVHASQ
ncbi:hypothetical protein SISNIDRAFT_486710 [Sistotremastrum niveocremeum HHB9708]|uniref:Alpha/gamma-adaptin-binding protein p34 n=1 Tax=Sistotremastrum niveocremeum HHB9708 TaxID=1314777 RepID=A0A164T997_9AGAM|nr:hypothetical protein SISNIDRAFT_486710 [Sistotremastrum niveocremeum HHB9708]